MKGISSADLMHHRLQAWLRENKCKDIEYLGERESYKSGKKQHFYRIGEHEVPVDAIEELEMVEVEDE
tara:strand:+ start:864 stop:1067 length:204 start_codon:yes stop_codon:yes gene_type:complete